METRIKTLLMCFAITGLSGCVLPLPSSTWCDGCWARPPTIQDVAKTWVGYTGDELAFFRLELMTNGTGRCASVHLPDTVPYQYGVNAYRVTRWRLKDFQVTLDLEPASTNSEPIYLKGSTSGHTMNMEVGSTALGWSRELVLRLEDNFTIPNRDTKRAIEEMARQAKSTVPAEAVPGASATVW
ncbi:MAG: hypothetical protein HN742_31120 [Lentisphaerae bacterium]|jgi:hypothetical protein|nr:hypothetical protein [Lentisphaerota bacterium]MBT4822460.1 hypothetical protein [Lentisphaerota bacterium]MBT5607908.1 hypothetical protein [Lentisphaerota bacterium]MBT7056572.1 hypothetical protein [Lentisphaerota bacterium]MBT7846363.1 hypothetical protein [Lentisphaerota bacterium]